MTKISAKELIFCIISIVALILVLTTNVFATEGVQGLNALLGDANNTNNTIPEDNNTVGNNTANNTINNTANNTANNVSNNATTNNNVAKNNTNRNNTTIPDAGLDQSIVFIIAIFGISAVYAYKKIRDYKNV